MTKRATRKMPGISCLCEAGDRILPPPSEHLENTITFGIFDPFTTNRICLKFKRLV
jgi:hypothetical protein